MQEIHSEESGMDLRQVPASDANPTNDAEARYLKVINNPEAFTIVPPNLVSEFERRYYYYDHDGLPDQDPLELYYRSDLETNPFPIPSPGSRLSDLPTRSPRGVFKTPLNKVWPDPLSSRIIEVMKNAGVTRGSSLSLAWFRIEHKGKITVGPIVIWIGLRQPPVTEIETLPDVTTDIFKVLSDLEINDVTIEWYEAGEVHWL